MKLREFLEHELCVLEFSTYLIDKTHLDVKDLCIGILFENNHTHIVRPSSKESKDRLLKDITYWLTKEK